MTRWPRLGAAVVAAGLVAVAAPAPAHSPAAQAPAAHPAAVTYRTVDRDAIDDPAALPAEGPRAAVPQADVTEPAVPAAIAILALLLGTMAARRPRLCVPAIAALALVILAFETGVHSVHHLGDERGAAECSVASATTHLAGATDAPPLTGAADAPASEILPSVPNAVLSGTALPIHAGRAPPLAA